jgi:hypothetical protein
MVLAELNYFYRQLCAREIMVEMIEKLEKEILVLLCKMEKEIPVHLWKMEKNFPLRFFQSNATSPYTSSIRS